MDKKREITLTVEELRAFEDEVVEKYEGANIRGPIHLSHGNETPLIDIFQYLDKNDWVFSTWRNHYHALLHGIDRNWLMNEVLSGRSINISNGDAKFHTSAIVGGIIPIATGTALAIKRRNDLVSNKRDTTVKPVKDERHVWCFVGDMAYSTGTFRDSYKYAIANDLPITFVVEDNGKSTNSPTLKCWNMNHDENNLYLHTEIKDGEILKIDEKHLWYYRYERTLPHVGCGSWIYF